VFLLSTNFFSASATQTLIFQMSVLVFRWRN
jgi:hypothetical protein